MHVVHRPELPHVAAITAACAALAVALTLLFAGTLNDLGSGSVPGSPVATPARLPATATGPGWALSPFASLLRTPVRAPWMTNA